MAAALDHDSVTYAQGCDFVETINISGIPDAVAWQKKQLLLS